MTVELWTDGECRAVKHLSAYTGVVVTRQLRVPLGDEFHEQWSFFGVVPSQVLRPLEDDNS